MANSVESGTDGYRTAAKLWYPLVPSQEEIMVVTRPQDSERRQCIVAAAYAVLMEKGFAGASTLEIARRARVSKRELYAEFGSKAGILEALIAATSAKMQ